MVKWESELNNRRREFRDVIGAREFDSILSALIDPSEDEPMDGDRIAFLKTLCYARCFLEGMNIHTGRCAEASIAWQVMRRRIYG